MSSTAVNLDDWDRDFHHDALRDLRDARKRNRVAEVDRFDAFYKAYVTAVFLALAVYSAAGLFGDAPIRGTTLDDIRTLGPSYLGVVVAFALAIGLRSGGRGGPLAFEQADVRHVLLSPVDRRDSIRSPALRQLRYSMFLGGALGGALGLLAVRRLPEAPATWVVSGAIFGAALMLGAYGLAMFMSGRRVSRPITDTLAFLIVVWSAFDAYFELQTSPFAWLAHVATWPLHFDLLGLAGIAVMIVFGVLGAVFVDGWSIEAAERRSRLVGQLRFAATMQDIRTVMVLQRQLSQEHVRVKPWIRIRGARRPFRKNGNPAPSVFVRRSLNGIMRWSFFRMIRLVVLVMIAGFAACGAWTGTTPLIVLSGICLWIVALDLLEPLAQDTDRPDRLRSMGRDPGWVLGRHLIVPGVLMFFLVSLGTIPAIMLGNDHVAIVNMWVPMVVLCTVLPLGGAAVGITRQPSTSSSSLSSPEIAGVMMLWRILMPPGLAVLAFLPFVIARREWLDSHDVAHMIQAMTQWWYVAFAFGTWALAWIRYGSELRERMELSGAQAVRGKDSEKK